MDIEIQSILEQDIDLGIQQSLNYDLELDSSQSSAHFAHKQELTYLNFKEYKIFEEDLKVWG